MQNIKSNEHLPDYLSKNFERENWKHSYNTSHSFTSNYVLPKIGTETGRNQYFIKYRRSGKKFHRIWNQNLLLLFKKTYTNHLISNYKNRWCLQSTDEKWSDVIQQHFLELNVQVYRNHFLNVLLTSHYALVGLAHLWILQAWLSKVKAMLCSLLSLLLVCAGL